MSFLDYFKDFRILAVIAIVLLLLAADVFHGINLGMDFAGGTQIQITFAHSINPVTFSALQSTLEQRLSKFGLSNPTIEGIGNGGSYIGALIQMPNASKGYINSTIQVIEKEGIFQEIVNGKEALNGSSLLGGSSSLQASYQEIGNNVTWIVQFSITSEAASRFARVVFGQANQPAYMFLDRPSDSIVLINSSALSGGSEQQLLSAMQNAASFGNQTIPIEIISGNGQDWNSVEPFFNSSKEKYKYVILGTNTQNSIKENLTLMGYTLLLNSAANMTPQFTTINTSRIMVDSWPAIGLLAAPILNPSITNGNVGEIYEIQGGVPPTYNTQQSAIAYAQNQSSTIVSVLSGGALPVQVIVGVPTTLPPTLGKHFEDISVLALLAAVIAVGMTIVIRYKKVFLIAPILLTTLAELFIIASVIGLVGQIDLAAVAGMIAVIGTGVDAQIIITDELLSGGKEASIKSKVSHAFYVVWADAILLIIAMLPLAFSTSLTQVIGFAYSTILGAMLGVILTRPAYAAMISRHYSRSGYG
jgi:preprotein translocase subunit SecD